MLRLLPALALLFFACRSDAQGPPERPAPAEPTRVVAVGDLHGDLDNALAVLRLAGVVDDAGHWAAGHATFVQTGDLTDRGPDSKGLIELLSRLEAEASEAGGRVVALIGNHEQMNVQGDWRYVTPGDVAAYGGMDARRAAFSATGDSGRYVRSHGATALVEDTVFVHGGIHPEWAQRGVDGINAAVRDGLDTPGAPVFGESGPLWFRGYALADEPLACPVLDEALTALGARRMVVGHTVQRTGHITTRCDGKLVLIDVGIADHYGGHLAAWEWVDGDTAALTPNGRVDLADPPTER